MNRTACTALCAAVALALPLTATAKTELRLINGFDSRQSCTRLIPA